MLIIMKKTNKLSKSLTFFIYMFGFLVTDKKIIFLVYSVIL